MKKSQEIQAEIDRLTDEAQAIHNLVESEKRDMSDDEQSRWNALMGDDGEIAAQVTAKASAEKLEKEQERLALMRQQGNPQPLQTTITGNGNVAQAASTPAKANALYRVAKPRCFKGADADQNAYNAGMFILALQARLNNQRHEQSEKHLSSIGWDIKAASTEGTATAGGYLVPDPLSRSIIDIREEVGVARRLAKVWPMSSDTDSVPKRTGGLTVYAPGEGNTITTSDKAWGRVNLVAKKKAVAHQISKELSEDAIINVADDAVEEMAYALADNEDEMFINGDGTSTYFGVTGVLNAIGSAGVATAATGNDTWPEISVTDIANWFGKLPGKFRRSGQLGIVCSSNFYHTALLRILMAAGGNTAASLQSSIADAAFLGYPVFFSDKMPTATAASTVSALFGNFRMSTMLGERGRISIGRSEEYAFLDDLTTLKATTRTDINVHEPGDSSNAGGYVALKTAS